jgi:Mrp family chromosome partitioning ATPase
MSSVEIVKSPIISVVRSANDASGKHNGHQALGVVEPAAVRSTETITTFAWNTSPIALIEEVELAERPDSRLVVLNAPTAAQAQGYRLLEQRLFAKGNPRVIAVTSAEPSAGKTTCAANLALVLAEASLSRVLLVDANVARPGLADLFAFEPSDSLMIKLLRSEDASPPYAVATLSRSSLQLAALRPGTTRGKRLDRALFADVLRGLRSAYDYVVVDAASVLESADAHCVGQSVDGVVLVARAGASRKSELRRAIRQLEPATVLGTVLLDG